MSRESSRESVSGLKKELEDDLRLIANPLHLSDVKVIKNDIKKVDYNDILKNTLSIQYPTIYLSDINLNDIKKLIDDYIRDINTTRVVDSLLGELIEKLIIDNKFDFCIPFN